MLSCFFPFTLSKKGIKELASKFFRASWQQRTHTNQGESPLPSKGEPKSHQKKANINSHKTLVFMQWIKMWLVDSSSVRQKKHLLARVQPLLFSWFNVKAFPHEASHAKKTHFGGNIRTPNDVPRIPDCISWLYCTVKGLNWKKSHFLSFSVTPYPPNLR